MLEDYEMDDELGFIERKKQRIAPRPTSPTSPTMVPVSEELYKHLEKSGICPLDNKRLSIRKRNTRSFKRTEIICPIHEVLVQKMLWSSGPSRGRVTYFGREDVKKVSLNIAKPQINLTGWPPPMWTVRCPKDGHLFWVDKKTGQVTDISHEPKEPKITPVKPGVTPVRGKKTPTNLFELIGSWIKTKKRVRYV